MEASAKSARGTCRKVLDIFRYSALNLLRCFHGRVVIYAHEDGRLMNLIQWEGKHMMEYVTLACLLPKPEV